MFFKEVFNMATTRLMPLHTGKGRTVGQAISDIIDLALVRLLRDAWR